MKDDGKDGIYHYKSYKYTEYFYAMIRPGA